MPERVGPYQILGELGAGGMGVVYRARRPGTDFDVAVKVIAAGGDGDRPDAGPSPENIARFQREARIATELDHPGIVKVLEVGEHEGNAWFAMELVEGEPLSKLIKEREFTWQEAVTIVRDVADALAIAHDKGVLHRDIKPSNILMDAEGKPHVTDFGLAKDTRTESKYTRTGQTLGTPAYMSPEQARGDLAQLTPASDVWALGCVLYELLANRPAFEGDTPAAVIGHVMGGRPQPLQATTQAVPAPVRQLIEACLSKTPAHRPASAGAFRADLDRVAGGRRPHYRAPRRRAPWLIAITATLLAGAAAGGAILWPREAPAPTIDPEAERLAARGWAARIDRPGDGAELLGRALTIEDGRHDWRVRQGILWWAAGRNADAVLAWKEVPESASEWQRAQLYLGLEIAFRLVGTPAASEGVRYAQAAAQAPGDLGRLARGLRLALEAKDPEALRTLADVPGWEAAYLRGHAAVRHDPKRAVREYTTGLAQGMKFRWAYFNRALMQRKLGNLREAVADFTAALAVDPDLAPAWCDRGSTKQELRDHAGAIADFDQALELFPGLVAALFGRGEAKRSLGDERSAIADFDAALGSDPTFVKALISRADARAALGEMGAAIADFDAAVILAPRNARALTNRGRAKAQEGDVAGAIADFSAALAADPKQLDARLNRGILRVRLGEVQAGIDDYNAMLAIAPDDVRALSNRGTAKLRLLDPEGALADLNAALNVSPNDVHALANRAAVHAQAGDFKAAVADLKRAWELSPPGSPYRDGIRQMAAQLEEDMRRAKK